MTKEIAFPSVLNINLYLGRLIVLMIPVDRWSSAVIESAHRTMESMGRAGLNVPVSRQWEFFQRRMTGTSPWTAWGGQVLGAAMESTRFPAYGFTYLERSGHVSVFEIGRLRYALDLLNPGNELGLPESALWPGYVALSLLVSSNPADPNSSLVISEDLMNEHPFYALLDALHSRLAPAHLFGGSSSHLSNVIQASFRNAHERAIWDFLYPLTVVPNAELASARPGWEQSFTVVRPISDGRHTLLQVRKGFDATVSETYTRAAAAIGRVAAQSVRGE